METMDRRLEESGIRRIIKLFDDTFNGGIIRNPYVNNINRSIDYCCHEISTEETSGLRQKELADALRGYFDSDYCAIGKVDENYLEDCIVSWVNINNENKYKIQQDNNLENVKRVRFNNQNCCVSRGLESTNEITYFDEDEIIKKAENYDDYKEILGEVRNTTIIPIRDIDDSNKGYIQFINSKKRISFYYIKPFYDSILRLILLIHQRDGLKLFNRDSDFLSEAQKKLDNIDLLLDEIMQYLSKEFNAGVVSYRIPLLVGLEKTPLFFLRDCYISEEITRYYNKEDYFRDRLIRTMGQMGGYDKLTCKNNDSVIIGKAQNSDYYDNISDMEIRFRDDTLILPILRDYSEKDECFYPQKTKGFVCNDELCCPYRFSKYFGVFKLRVLISSGTLDNKEAYEWPSDESKKRLSNFAKHISILLNAFVEKCENKSLNVFKKELKGTSFTKIKQFDEQCSMVVKKAIHACNCVIYRYKNDKLAFSASSDPISNNFNDIIENYCENSDGFVKKLFAQKEPVYFIRNDSKGCGSIMLVPIIGKDNSKLGVMLLVGKEDNLSSGYLSKTFWEHDKKHVEFIVDVLTRIEESDSERLTFLSQLSHELLRPVTEMVYRNDYHISTSKKNPGAYSNKTLINEMQKNVDMCMMFKYIIDDVEYIYSLSKGDANYVFEMANLKDIILDAIRLSEEEAYNSKSLTIKTYLGKMPEELYIDKSRMTQVIINLLRNAIRYSDIHKEIFISYEFNKRKNCHEISFEDIGLPVETKDKERIFELYYRSKNASEKAPNGSGIGLYLVKQIMLAHGGDCYVKKEEYPTIITIQIPNK